jgi:hypothetical protein
MKVVKDDTNIRWFIDDVIMATVPLSAVGTTGGNNILLGEFDTSASSGTGTGADQLNFGLFDNVVVTNAAVPEPATLSLLGLGLGAAALRRRRQARARN